MGGRRVMQLVIDGVTVTGVEFLDLPTLWFQASRAVTHRWLVEARRRYAHELAGEPETSQVSRVGVGQQWGCEHLWMAPRLHG